MTEEKLQRPSVGMNRRVAIVIGIVIFLAGLAAGINLFQVGGPFGPVPTPTASPTATATSTATSTPTATATSTATATNSPTATFTATFTATPTSTPTATSTPTPTATPVQIFVHVRTMGNLDLVSFEMARADIHVGINRGLCSHGADHVAEVVIDAGIDFGGIGQEDISYDHQSDTYVFRVSPPAITSCQVSYIDQYDRSRTWCGTDWGEVKILGAVQSMPLFIERALARGILEKAETHAEIVLGSFVNGLTGRRAHITFAERDAIQQLPLSCRPEAPEGWRYDEESAGWEHRS